MFITFEGIDYCGKTTQIKKIETFFNASGKKVRLIREPGGTNISEKIRDILLDKVNLHMVMESELFLFSAARAQLVREVILPELEKDVVVISDRFHDSTTAYQGYGRGIPLESIEQINNLAIGKAIPDITFFIDIPVKEAERRKNENQRGEPDRMELAKTEFYEKVRTGYLKLAEKEKRFRTIDGMMSIQNIHQKIVKEIERYVTEV